MAAVLHEDRQHLFTDSEPLGIQHYDNPAVGGMTRALSIHADEAYQKLTDDQKIVAEKMFKQHNYSLVLLDINLPYKNGLALCKEFREFNSKVPIIMLTALGELKDKMDAFNLGADDYIVKPFEFDELSAR